MRWLPPYGRWGRCACAARVVHPILAWLSARKVTAAPREADASWEGFYDVTGGGFVAQ